jgi:hypothetical protein
MTTNNTTTANVNVNEIKSDPVAWAKKGNKVTNINVADLKPDPTINIRHRAGSSVYGVTVEKDTLDIPSMKAQIVEMVGIQEPILVSVRKGGEMVPLRGNRRTYAGQELLADATIGSDLREALTKHTPAILLHGLTTEQERELIQDQTQKPFLRSELLKHVFALRASKWTFDRIAMVMWEALGRFSGNAKKIAEVRDLTDPNAKREKIKTWLRGTLDNYMIWGYDLGEFVRKTMLLSEMKLDGVLPETAEKPYFLTTKDGQKRIAALKKAKEADGSKWNGTLPQEGSEFKKKLDEFHSQDYGTKPATATTSGPKMMQRKDLEGIKDSFSSRAVKAMIDRVLGNEVPDLTTVDEFAGQMETKALAVENYLPRLKPDVAAILRLVFVNPDATDFVTFLESNCVEQETEEPKKDESFPLTDEAEGDTETAPTERTTETA